ncbi:16S rRNA (guanine(527)-N(7))-methyltransferase RsmG [Sporanaerobacter acetigenes]|uniref:Ribosomal RNA small subunit methyltransferase G n=1 Tax=Sporanaerobacter acetigenes DSM 13106 TaxID=1123281 RepID=A0A1M5YTM1_9FIRM|nr:16S rRNA (guanine(527)-N(7))-methyltransferase RsmG [Sporanaerobacter acetigenes]SHI15416.1 16S rRNA m(7)G-527 methyltransferase [Sporanaerobacter acetigenes DSM 13106]
MTNVKTLIEGSKELNIDINKENINKFILYKELLLDWNQKINITAIEDDEEIDIKHFLDSLTPLKTKLFERNVKVIDIGTGGGFPGIPIKIVKKNVDMVLLDSLNKRIMFLNEVIDKLELKNIGTIHGRAEDFGKNKIYREVFDVAISRAVAPLNILCEYCLPFVKVGGFFVSMKGKDVEEEIESSKKALKILGGEVKDKVLVEIPNSNITHSLIIIEKISKTPTKYPRQAGKPKKNPL